MKLYKYLLATAATVLFSAGFAACDDEVDYTPAAYEPGAYFPASSPTSVKLSADATSFSVTIDRTDSEAEQTFNLVNNFVAGEFSMPATVTFPAGVDEQEVEISYNPATLAPGTYTLKIGFAEGQAVSEYGLSELTITVQMPAPAGQGTWTSLGKGTFTMPFLGMFSNIKPCTYQVEVEKSDDTEGVYRLKAPFGTAFAEAMARTNGLSLGAGNYDADNECDMIIHAEDPNNVYILPTESKIYLNASLGEMVFCNDYGYDLAAGTNEAVTKATFSKGIFTMPAKNALAITDAGVYYGNASAAVRFLALPGVSLGDYTCPIEYLGQFVSPAGDSKISASVGFGANTAAVRLGVTKGGDATALIAALSDGSAENMVEIARRDADHSGSFDIIAGGQYTFAAVSMDKNGEVKESSTLSVYVNLFGDDAAWNDLGEGAMADGWVIGAVFGLDPLKYAFPVNIQESKKQPKLYRVVDPYHSANCPAPNSCATKGDIYIDMADSEVIPVYPQFSGWGDYEVEDGKYIGDMYLANFEGYLMGVLGYTKEEILEVDPETGTNSVATIFEDDVLVMNMPFFNLTGNLIPNNWYYGESASYILFPGSDESQAAAKIKAAKARKVTTKPSVKFASRFEIKSNLNRIDESARRR